MAIITISTNNYIVIEQFEISIDDLSSNLARADFILRIKEALEFEENNPDE